jgi:hypothetical protein
MKYTVLLLLLLGLAGCARKEPAPAGAVPAGGHTHAAPHGGQLVGLGEHQFNLEFKYDAARGVLQAWVLDGHAENFVRVSMTLFDVQEAGGQKRVITLQAVASGLTGERVGDTSAFEGDAAWLAEVGHFDGVVKAIQVRDSVFREIGFHFHPRG